MGDDTERSDAAKARPWRGYEDLPAMQSLAIEQRRRLGARAPWHVGDLAWGMRQHVGREQEWKIRLWEEAGEVVAWSWAKGEPAELELDVRADRRELLPEILAEPDVRTVFALADDDELRTALADHGFVTPGDPMHFNVLALDEPPEVPALPDGFRFRTVEAQDLAERVAIHRDVWAPSRVTEESYANVVSTWPYRASLDCVVEALDSRFAAYCLVWPDDENGVGELEPVGVRDEFRRRGLGAAVCSFALRRLYEEGGREAIVYCSSGPACALYESLGFRRHASIVGYSR